MELLDCGPPVGARHDPAKLEAVSAPKVQEELAGTRFETLSSIYDKVEVEEMRAAREQADQAVSALS